LGVSELGNVTDISTDMSDSPRDEESQL